MSSYRRVARTLWTLFLLLSLLLSPAMVRPVVAQSPTPRPIPETDSAPPPLAKSPTPVVDTTATSADAELLPPVLLRGAPAQADPFSPGDPVLLRVHLEAQEAVPGATLKVVYPEGLESADAAADTRILTFPLGDLAAGAILDRDIELRLLASARDISVVRLEVWSTAARGPATAEVEVRRAPTPSVALATVDEGGTLASADGRVALRLPAGAVERDVRITHRPVAAQRLTGRGAELALQFELTAATADEAQTPVDRFAKPLELRVDLTGLVDLLDLAPHQHPYLGYWDEAAGEWMALEARQEGNVLVAEVDHFTLYGAGTTVGLSTGWALTCNEANVSLFDGALSYALPLRTPAGSRAGA